MLGYPEAALTFAHSWNSSWSLAQSVATTLAAGLPLEWVQLSEQFQNYGQILDFPVRAHKYGQLFPYREKKKEKKRKTETSSKSIWSRGS